MMTILLWEEVTINKQKLSWMNHKIADIMDQWQDAEMAYIVDTVILIQILSHFAHFIKPTVVDMAIIVDFDIEIFLKIR